MTPAQFRKAIVAAALAGLSALAAALSAGHVGPAELSIVAAAIVTAGGGVFAVPNAPADLPPTIIRRA